jgi:hypothetical protein
LARIRGECELGDYGRPDVSKRVASAAVIPRLLRLRGQHATVDILCGGLSADADFGAGEFKVSVLFVVVHL